MHIYGVRSEKESLNERVWMWLLFVSIKFSEKQDIFLQWVNFWTITRFVKGLRNIMRLEEC